MVVIQNPSVANDAHPETTKLFTLDFFVCYASFLSLLLNNLFGMIAIIGFLAPWTIILMLRKKRVQAGILANWQLFILPALAGLSVSWSEDPAWTLKSTAELIVTVVIGIVAATCIHPRQLMNAFLCTLLTVAFLSVATMWSALQSSSGDVYMDGIFGSKNAFAAMMSLLLLTSIAVAIDKQQHPLFRLTAFASLIFTPPLLYLANSVGAIVAVILTILVLLMIRIIIFLPSGLRWLVYFLMFAFVVIMPTILYLADINTDLVLQFLGKDASLTGRTFLWQRGTDMFTQRPFLGTGYSAFWRVDNPRAQELWYAMKVPPGPGFNFHNEYIEQLVELGVVGCTVFVGYLIILTKNAFKSITTNPRYDTTFAFVIYIYSVSRTPLEVGLFGQFSMGMIIFCLLWVYLKPEPATPVPKTTFNIYKASEAGAP